MKKVRQGFTLIELLVVISIIALLSSVVLSSLSTAREKARQNSVKSGAIELAKSIELHRLSTNSYDNYVANGGFFFDAPEDCKDGITAYNNREFISNEGAKICSNILNNFSSRQPNDNTGVGNMSVDIDPNTERFAIRVKLVDTTAYTTRWFCIDAQGVRKEVPGYTVPPNYNC